MDFIRGGFPICQRAPVICMTSTGKMAVAYNRYDLKMILAKLQPKACLGVWPGKKSSDVFILDPVSYQNEPTPPEIHKDVDSSLDIKVINDREGKFVRVEYVPGPHIKDQTPVVCHEQSLAEYLKKTAKHAKTVFEK